MNATDTTFRSLIGDAIFVLDLLTPVFYGLALAFFFWGLAKFIFALNSGNEKGAQGGKTMMWWGVIALFVAVSIWGLIRFLISDFGFGIHDSPPYPTKHTF
jgi:hypothetical protein